MKRQWVWRLPHIYRFGIFLCHRLPRGHADRLVLAHDIQMLLGRRR